LIAVLALVLAAAAGCARTPAGVDKDLIDGWSMMAEAKVPEPEVGACWTTFADTVWDLIEVSVATMAAKCDTPHVVETVHVGHFTGAPADADRPPSLDQMAEQYTACEAELAKFLGGSWRTGRVRMLVYAPTSTQWRGGARFWRCDVASLVNLAGAMDQRTASLKGSLLPGGDRLLGCATRGTDDSWSDMTPAACTAPHDMEFLGLVPSKTATEPADQEGLKAAFGAGCLDRLRAYTRASDNTLYKAKARYGYLQLAAGKEEWAAGNHDAVCFLLLPKQISRSVKNNGNVAI
jgi:hypothetical protein